MNFFNKKRNLKFKYPYCLLFFLILNVCAAIPSMAQTTYYSNKTKSGTDAGKLSSWSTGTNGTGSSPTNFTTSGDVFVIQSGHRYEIANEWKGNTGSHIQVNSGGSLDLNGSSPEEWGSIKIAGSGVSSSGAIFNSGNNPSTIITQIILNDNASISASDDDISLTSIATINTNGYVLTVDGSQDTDIESIISGTGGLTKTGSGTLTLSGANTFSGGITLSQGKINIDNNSALGTGIFTINSGTTINALTSNRTIDNPISIKGSFTFTGTYNLTQNTGEIALKATRTFTITANTLALNGTVSGAFGITKAGSGKLVLSGLNTYSGITTVSAGILNIQNAQGTGTTAGGVTVASGAALELEGNITVGAEALTLNNNGISSAGALRNISGNNTWGGLITLSTNAVRINSDAGTLNMNSATAIATGTISLLCGGAGDMIISGIITGSGALTKDGNGTLTLSGLNTYTGPTSITSGKIKLGASGDATNGPLGTIASGTSVYKNVGVTNACLDLAGYTLGTAEALSIKGTGISSSGALMNSGNTVTYSGKLTLLGSSTIVSTSGAINLSNTDTITGASALTLSGDYGGSISSIIGTGIGSLTKTGTGNWSLLKTNTYTGATTVSAGILTLGAAQSLSSNLTIASGATLNAAGYNITINGNWSNSGTYTAGASTVDMTGTSKTIGGSSNSNFYNLTISGSTSLGVNTDVSNVFNLNSAILTLGSYDITLGVSGTVTGTPSATNMVVATGTGHFHKTFAAGNTAAFTYPIGDATITAEYSPVTLGFSENIIQGTVGARVTDADHPSIGTTTNRISRYWSFITNTLSSYTYSASFSYLAADPVGIQSLMKLSRYNGSWNQIDESSASANVLSSGATALTETTAPLNGNAFTGRFNSEPQAQPASFSATATSSSTIRLNFPAASDISSGSGYIILKRTNNGIPTTTGITDGTAPGSLSLPSGTDLVTTINSTSTTLYINTGLNSSTRYDYAIIPFFYDGSNASTYNYRTSDAINVTYATTSISATAMTYTSSSVTQSDTLLVGKNTSSNHIIGITVETSNPDSPLSASSFTFATTGSTSALTDISNAKLYYSGTTNTFALANQFGSIVNNPNGTFTFTGSQILEPGSNYFWLTYSIRSSAIIENVVDAVCSSITIGTPRTPSPTTVEGSRKIANNWAGGTLNNRTNWHTATNWSDGVPTSSINALIPGGLNYYPVISSDAVAKSIRISNGGTVTISGSNSLSLSVDFQNDGSFVQNSSTVAFVSATEDQAITGDNSTTFYNLTVNNTKTDGIVALGRNITVSNNLTLTKGALSIEANTLSANSISKTDGTINGGSSSNITLNGTTSLPAVNNGLNNLTINTGTTTLTENTSLIGTLTVASGTTLNVSSYSPTVGSISGAGIIDAASGTPTLTIGSDNSSKSFTGQIKNTAGSLAITKIGSGALTLSGANTYSGVTTLSSGTININNASALGSGTFNIIEGAIDNTSGSAITLSTNNAMNWHSDFTFTGTNDLNLGSGAVTLTENNLLTTSANKLTVGGIISGTYNLTKSGSGTLILSGTNTYTGNTLVSAGILKLGNAGGVPDASALIVSSGATFNLNGYSETVGSVAGDGTVDGSSGTPVLTCGGDNSSTVFSGLIKNTAGSLGLTKIGSGALTLSSSNTYSGNTSLSAGKLNINHPTAIGTGTIVISGGILDNTSDASITLSNNNVINWNGNFTFA